MFKNFLLVGFGGAIGAVLRYALGLLGNVSGLGGNLTTFGINVIGSFALGLLTVLLQGNPLLLFVGVGICGGFTTFSTFSVQAVTLFQSGKIVAGLAYAIGSVAACIIFAALGYLAGSRIQLG